MGKYLLAAAILVGLAAPASAWDDWVRRAADSYDHSMDHFNHNLYGHQPYYAAPAYGHRRSYRSYYGGGQPLPGRYWNSTFNGWGWTNGGF